MTPLKLYLLRAVYDWAVENGLTPHIIVDAAQPGVQVPPGFVQDGKIVLNISPRAVQDFALGETGTVFSARFNGRSHQIECPMGAIRAVYARENGQGVSFPDSDDSPTTPAPPEPAAPAPRKGPVLKRIK